MSRRAFGEHLYTYRGYVYCPKDEILEDNIKRQHNVVCCVGGICVESRSVPLSPYNTLSEAQFQRWIQMGQPTREKMGGHLQEHHDKYWRKLFDEGLDKILLEVE